MNIKDLSVGMTGQLTALCSKVSQKTTSSGKPFYAYEFSDSTGNIFGNKWDVDFNDNVIVSGLLVNITYEVTEYNGNKQLKVNSIELNTTADPYLYIPKSDIPIDEFYNYLVNLAHSLEDVNLKKLVLEVLFNASITNKIKTHSAAEKVHHARVGGWLEHTVGVLNMCVHACNYYKDVDKDLLISAAMLHDIGKLLELTDFPKNERSDKGRLLGHINIGYEMVTYSAVKLGIRSDRKVDLLLHCILSHHGKLEYGSPILPACLEAYILHCVDMIDSHVDIFRQASDNIESGEWSVKNFYLGTCVTIS